MTLKEWLKKSEELENSRLGYTERRERASELNTLYKSVEIEVGDRGTEILWSDRNPIVVTEVLTKNRVVVRNLDYEIDNYADGEGIIKNEVWGEPTIISRRKNGYWYKVGRPMASGEVVYTFKYCRAYRDPSF